ncbi:hypothetical protein [Tenacibaculum aquimarinum]|uniref:hypothetical protein n=1 Tax=Tenacibaculum aquimarinum TaxID=2910675 RepID=UPI001F0AFDBE|nr:hypothetical protein [Tenacibaculum aquimarinum]MCH3884526.1 hypothetical protein [Tenacibaculum aquimarinum]
MIEILQHISNYLNSLDWSYILTFIVIAYGLNHYRATDFFYEVFKLKIATRYRVFIIGLVYGIALYFIRGYQLKMIEYLLQSFAFALVFHKLLLEKFLNRLFQSKPKA